MRFIQHPETGEFIPAHEYQRPLRQRSDLPSPMLIRDHIDPLQHPADGKYYDSKSQIRAVAKAHNLIEVGTEAQKDNRVRDEVTRDDVGQAIQKLNQGYQPNVQSEELPL